MQKTVLMVLLGIVIGPLSLASLVAPHPMVHRYLANDLAGSSPLR